MRAGQLTARDVLVALARPSQLLCAVHLHGDLAPFAQLLHQGQWLHVGKNATMGLGRYRLTAAQAGSTPTG